jgi:hypothetical protein
MDTNIQMDLEEVGHEVMNYILSKVMDFTFHKRREIY